MDTTETIKNLEGRIQACKTSRLEAQNKLALLRLNKPQVVKTLGVELAWSLRNRWVEEIEKADELLPKLQTRLQDIKRELALAKSKQVDEASYPDQGYVRYARQALGIRYVDVSEDPTGRWSNVILADCHNINLRDDGYCSCCDRYHVRVGRIDPRGNIHGVEFKSDGYKPPVGFGDMANEVFQGTPYTAQYDHIPGDALEVDDRPAVIEVSPRHISDLRHLYALAQELQAPDLLGPGDIQELEKAGVCVKF